jgi:hypothetical protein
MLVAGGILAQLIAIAMLREAQRRGRTPLLILALAVLAGSAAVMARPLGWELGLAWALTAISIVAYGLILPPFFRARSVGHSRPAREGRRMPAPPSGSKWRLTVKLLAAGPLYLLAALGLSLLIATRPWEQELTRLYIGGLTTPLFWSVGALHATVDPSLIRVAASPILIALAAFGAFYLT